MIGSGVGAGRRHPPGAEGHAVTVYEAGEGPGGKLSELRLGGYRFDRGPSLFTRPGLVAELFHEAGVPLEGRFAWRKLEEANRYFGRTAPGCAAGATPTAWPRSCSASWAWTHAGEAPPAARGRAVAGHGAHLPGALLHRWSDLREGDVWEALTAAPRRTAGQPARHQRPGAGWP